MNATEKYGGCNETKIYCPTDKNSRCDIKCVETGSCYLMMIEGDEYNLINMDCLSEGSCINTTISAPDAEEINVLCFEHNACFGLDIDGKFTKTISMVCTSNTSTSPWWDHYTHDQACNYVNIIASNISGEFNLECDGQYACENVYIDAKSASVININAIGVRPLYLSEIHGENADKVNIISFAEDSVYCANDVSCAAQLYLPGYTDINSPPTSITCQGYGCYNLNLYSKNGLFDYKFKLNGCGICNQGYLCYADWNIYCGNHYQNELTVWSGEWCWDDMCGCYEKEGELGDSWDTYNSLTCDSEQNKYNYTCKYDGVNYPGYCIIDCAQAYYTSTEGCRGKTINATNEKSSVIINCGNSDGSTDGAELGLCENTKIYCPEKLHSECVVNCIDDDSCTYAKIYAQSTTIAPGSEHINTLWVKCSDYGSCEYTKIISPYIKQIDVFCDNTDACYGLQIEATYVDTMNIVCKSSEQTYDYNNYYYWEPWMDSDTDTDGGGRRRMMMMRAPRKRRRRLQRYTSTLSPSPDSEYEYGYGEWEDWWDDWSPDDSNNYDDWYYDYTDWNDWEYRSNYACDQITVDANYSNDFNIFCDGNSSCYYSFFYGDYAENVNVTAIGQESLYFSYIYTTYVSDNVDIKCWSAYDYGKQKMI